MEGRSVMLRYTAVDVKMREVLAMDVTTELMTSMTLRFCRA
jgi:hypothetical protein